MEALLPQLSVIVGILLLPFIAYGFIAWPSYKSLKGQKFDTPTESL